MIHCYPSLMVRCRPPGRGFDVGNIQELHSLKNSANYERLKRKVQGDNIIVYGQQRGEALLYVY